MDERFLRVVVGLALESALVHRRCIPSLVVLYGEPDIERVQELHDQLIVSGDHYEREVAIWLEPALERGMLGSDPTGLVREMREMEFVLYNLISRTGEVLRDVNDWMNFIANTAHSLEDGFWIDAKILLSRALQISRRPSVEQLKYVPNLMYEIDVLQRATESYFEELKNYPLRLRIPEDGLDAMLEVQETMLGLMRIHYSQEQEEDAKITGPPIHRLSVALRYLMDEEKGIEAAKRELQLALVHLEAMLSKFVDEGKHEQIEVYKGKIKQIVNAL